MRVLGCTKIPGFTFGKRSNAGGYAQFCAKMLQTNPVKMRSSTCSQKQAPPLPHGLDFVTWACPSKKLPLSKHHPWFFPIMWHSEHPPPRAYSCFPVQRQGGEVRRGCGSLVLPPPPMAAPPHNNPSKYLWEYHYHSDTKPK